MIMPFQAAESLAEQIAQHLSRQIVIGGLKPGERIQELKVAAELKVSRGSVREALLLLQRRHIIEIYPRRGAIVAEISERHVENLYDLLAVLVALLIQEYARLRSEGDLFRMKERLEQLESLAADTQAPTEEKLMLTLSLFDLCYPVVDNPLLQETLENLKPALSRTYYLAIQNSDESLLDGQGFFLGLLTDVRDQRLTGIANSVQEFTERQKQRVLEVLRVKADEPRGKG